MPGETGELTEILFPEIEAYSIQHTNKEVYLFLYLLQNKYVTKPISIKKYYL